MPEQNQSENFGDTSSNLLAPRIYWKTLRAVVSRKIKDFAGKELSFTEEETILVNLALQEPNTRTDFSSSSSTLAKNLEVLYLCDFLAMSELRKLANNSTARAKEKTEEIGKQLGSLRTDLVGLRNNRRQLQDAIVKNDSLDKIDEEAAKLFWELQEIELESAKGIVKQDYRRLIAAKRQRLSVLNEAKDYLLLDVLSTDAGKAIKNIDSTLKILVTEFLSLGYDLYEALEVIDSVERERKEYLSSAQREEDILSRIGLIQALAEKTETDFVVAPAKNEILCPKKIIEEMEVILKNDPALFGSGTAGKPSAKISIVLVPHANFGQFSIKELAFFVPLTAKENLQEMLISFAARYRLAAPGQKQEFIKYRQAAKIPPEIDQEQFTQKFISDYKQWQTTDSKGFQSLPGKVREWFVKTIQNAN